MLKIHKLFFRSFLAIFLVTIFTITFVVYFWAKNLYLEDTKLNLSQNMDSLLILLKQSDLDHIQEIIKDLGAKLNLRVSVIDQNGNVIAESENLELTENHLYREEIINANKYGQASSVRFSKSLQKELLYVAKKFEIDNKIYFIRMSAFTDKIFDNFKKLIFEIFIYILFFLLISFFVRAF